MRLNQETSAITKGNVANYGTPWSLAEYTREAGLRPIEGALIDEFFPPAPATVLDLGCGAGRTTIGLAHRGFRITGIDLSEALLARARQRHAHHGALAYQMMDATRLAFRDACFDAALFSYNGIDCIYPVAARLQCLAEVFRVLKPGGVFLFSSHNLIGSIFSGGYHYLRGYWNAARLILTQCANPAVRGWYVRYRDGGGVQHLYSAPPGHTVRHLEEVGLPLLALRGDDGERRPRALLMHHQHVHFAARKPT
jgi:SAM-dependent methyltransferase